MKFLINTTKLLFISREKEQKTTEIHKDKPNQRGAIVENITEVNSKSTSKTSKYNATGLQVTAWGNKTEGYFCSSFVNGMWQCYLESK